MLLIDILPLISETTTVRVFNNEYEEIAYYDGRNSIPEEYNSMEIYRIYPARQDVLNIIMQ